jgi:hypothetical protein
VEELVLQPFEGGVGILEAFVEVHGERIRNAGAAGVQARD